MVCINPVAPGKSQEVINGFRRPQTWRATTTCSFILVRAETRPQCSQHCLGPFSVPRLLWPWPRLQMSVRIWALLWQLVVWLRRETGRANWGHKGSNAGQNVKCAVPSLDCCGESAQRGGKSIVYTFERRVCLEPMSESPGGLHSRISDSVGLGWDLGMGVSNILRWYWCCWPGAALWDLLTLRKHELSYWAKNQGGYVGEVAELSAEAAAWITV